MSDATSSQDTFISVDSGLSSPGTFTEIAEVKTIPGPNETSEDIDVTHLRSTGGYREFIPSFKDSGELACTTNFLPDNPTHQVLRDLYAARTVVPWRITYPTGATDEFDGYVKSVGRTAQVGNALEASFTIRITGPVTLTPASTSP
jgi:hypothetical protein